MKKIYIPKINHSIASISKYNYANDNQIGTVRTLLFFIETLLFDVKTFSLTVETLLITVKTFSLTVETLLFSFFLCLQFFKCSFNLQGYLNDQLQY